MQQELGACQPDDASRQRGRPKQDEPMLVLSGMVMGSKEGMDRGGIEECDLAQIHHDRLDIGPFEMRQVVYQDRARCQIELTTDGHQRNPVANLNVHRTLLLEHDSNLPTRRRWGAWSRPWVEARTCEPWTEARHTKHTLLRT